MKTQIILVGHQLAPLYFTVREFKPEKLILIHSSDTKTIADRLAAACSTKLEKSLPKPLVVKYCQVNPFNPNTLFSRAQKLLSELDAASTVVNYTGGTKLMSIAFYQAFSHAGADLYYVDTQHHNYLHTKNGEHNKENFHLELDFNEFFRLIETTDFDYAESNNVFKRRALTLHVWKWIMDKKDSQARLFRIWRDTLVKTDHPEEVDAYKLFPDQTWGSLHIGRENKNGKWVPKIEFEGSALEGRKMVSWVSYFTGGWYEELCFLALKETKLFDDIKLNVVFKTRAGKREPFSIKNEVDIWAIKNGVPYMFECKGGKIGLHDLNNIETRGKSYGGLFGKNYLISPKKPKDDNHLEKLNDYKIINLNTNGLHADFSKLVAYFKQQLTP